MYNRKLFQIIKKFKYTFKACNYHYGPSYFQMLKPNNKYVATSYLKKEITHSYSQDYSKEHISDQFIIYMMNNNDRWFYNLICPNIYQNSGFEDPLISELQNSYSVEDLFEFLESHAEPLSLDQASQTVFCLSNIKHNRQFKYKNSLLHFRQEEEFYNLVSSHVKFDHVLDIIKEESSVERVPSLMMCLSNIGMELRDDLMVKLHLKMLQSISSLHLISLVRLSFVFMSKGIKSYFTQTKILNEANGKLDYLSTNDIFCLSLLYYNMNRLISEEEQLKYLKHIKQFTDEKTLDECNITGLLLILSTLRKFFKFKPPVKVYKSILKSFMNRIEEFTPQQLAVLITIYYDILEPKNLLWKIQECASRFIDKSDSMSLKSNLLLSLSLYSGFKKVRKYESIASELINKPFEHHDTGSLFKLLKYLKSPNFSLYSTFWSKSLENVKARLSHSEETIGAREKILHLFYHKYLLFNNNLYRRFRYYEAEQEMISLMKQELEGSSQHFPKKFASMIGFIIAYSEKEILSECWYEALEKNINQLNIYNIIILSRGLQIKLHDSAYTAKNARFISKLKNLLDNCTDSYLKNRLSLQAVITLTVSYLNRQGSPFSPLFMKLNNECERYLEDISSNSINRLTAVFKKARFMNTKVFETITDYLIENKEDVMSIVVYHVLSCFFMLGYTPEREEDLVDVCQDIVKECEQIPCHALLESCLALGFYNALPRELIHFIFRVEYLEHIEEEIKYAGNVYYSNLVKDLLMWLNRVVCLEYPEEKVPWFHEKYCQDYFEMNAVVLSAFHKDVGDVLESILQGKEFFSFNTKSPYGYNIDIEFAVNKNGIPIPMVKKEKKNSMFEGVDTTSQFHSEQELIDYNSSDIKKFAVLIRQENCYSTNDVTRTGRCQIQRRHLEILGFYVVEVLERDFYSMAVATREDKEKLMKSLIREELIKSS